MAGACGGLRWVLESYFLGQRPQSPELEDKGHLFFCRPLAWREDSSNGHAIKYGTKVQRSLRRRRLAGAVCVCVHNALGARSCATEHYA